MNMNMNMHAKNIPTKSSRCFQANLLSLLFLLLFPQWLTAADVFTRCHINKEKLVWGEACRITLAVYTRTWFTEGVSFPDMAGQSGVLLKPDRSYTSTEIIGGNRYSVISQEYVYYPLGTGEQVIRFGSIEVHTPSAGEYKSKKLLLDFPGKQITVHAASVQHQQLTASAQHLRLTTATKLKAHQSFEMPDTLRVGDVIVRRIDYTASGVPAAFIVLPEVSDTLSYAHVIQEQPAYLTELKNKNVSGRATQKILYQLTDSGTFTLPSIQVDYRSLKHKRINRLTLEEKAIHVLPALYTSDLPLPKEKLVSMADEINGKGIEKLFYAGILFSFVALLLFIMYWRKYVRRSIYWKVLSASDFLQLYDALYKYARTLHFNDFREVADKDVKLRNCYDELMLRLFKEGRMDRVNWYIKFQLFYFFICHWFSIIFNTD